MAHYPRRTAILFRMIATRAEPPYLFHITELRVGCEEPALRLTSGIVLPAHTSAAHATLAHHRSDSAALSQPSDFRRTNENESFCAHRLVPFDADSRLRPLRPAVFPRTRKRWRADPRGSRYPRRHALTSMTRTTRGSILVCGDLVIGEFEISVVDATRTRLVRPRRRQPARLPVARSGRE